MRPSYETWAGDDREEPPLSTETDEHMEQLAQEEADKAEEEE